LGDANAQVLDGVDFQVVVNGGEQVVEAEFFCRRNINGVGTVF
jgi:hypothetical protein